MPRHEDFEKIYQNFVEQYSEEEGEGKYFAWLKEHGYDDTKSFPKKESFNWVGDVKPVPGEANLIRGQALHPLKTLHPDEWPGVRVYLEEELQKSAHTLAGTPLLLDHSVMLRGDVTGAEYEDGAIEYVAKVDDPRILDSIQTGDIKHCSVEFEWESLENVEGGVAPKGIKFTGLSLLKNFAPGDPLTTVEVWEGLVKVLREAKLKSSAPASHGAKPAGGDTGESKMGEEKRPQTLEGRVSFLETSKLLKEQQLSKEEIEAKINELTQQRQELENQLQQIAEEEQPKRDEIWQQIDLISAQLCAHEEALAALIAGTAAPPEGGSTGEGKAKEQGDSPGKAAADRAKQHFNISDEDWDNLSDEEKQAYIDQLPPPGTKLENQSNQEPEKDEHGCKIGEEEWDGEKCVPIKAKEQQSSQEPPEGGEPKPKRQRFMDHYGLTDEQMDNVLNWIGEDIYKLLPEPGTKRKQQQAAEKKKGLGEAILGLGESSEPVGYVSVEKLERILPHPRQYVPWGVRTHLVDPLRRLIFEAKKEAA